MKNVLIVFLCCAAMAASAQSHRHRHRPSCATPEQMQMILRTLEKQSFDDKRVEVAELCVVLGHFCVRDLAEMAGTFTFDAGRLEFLKFAHPYCTNPEAYPMLRDTFTFSSNFEKLLDAVRPPNPKEAKRRK